MFQLAAGNRGTRPLVGPKSMTNKNGAAAPFCQVCLTGIAGGDRVQPLLTTSRGSPPRKRALTDLAMPSASSPTLASSLAGSP